MRTVAEKDPHKVLVGDRLRALAAELGLKTASDLARLLGAERAQVSAWLNGVAYPPAPWASRLCEKCPGLTLDWLFRGVPDALPHGLYIRLQAAMDAEPLQGRTEKARGFAP
jgi:transcriptional regulator with XRE-family HTH domain